MNIIQGIVPKACKKEQIGHLGEKVQRGQAWAAKVTERLMFVAHGLWDHHNYVMWKEVPFRLIKGGGRELETKIREQSALRSDELANGNAFLLEESLEDLLRSEVDRARG